MNPLIPIIVVLLSNFLGAIGVLLLKLGSKEVTWNVKVLLTNPKILIGFFCSCISAAIFIIMLKFGNLSVLYSLSSTTYIWITLFSRSYLNEMIPPLRYVGIFGIVVGVIFIVL